MLTHRTEFASSTPTANDDLPAPTAPLEVVGEKKIHVSPVSQPATSTVTTASPLYPTIFHEDWWLNLSTNGAYRVAEVISGGQVVGRLPYFCKRRFGIMWNGQPNMTHFLGPAIDEGTGNASTRFTRRISITHELLEQLPKAQFLQIKCHRDIRDAVAFQKDKFRTTVQFTYEIHPKPEDVAWSQFRDKTRNVIRRASEKLEVGTMTDADEFLAFYKSNLQKKGINNYLNDSICKNLISGSIERGVGRIWTLRNKQGELAAAIFCVWDKASCYYLMSTRNEEAGNGGISLLIWEALRFAMARGLVFDFDGLYNTGGILLYSGFGGVVSPRYIATKMTLPMFMGYTLLKSAAEHTWYA